MDRARLRWCELMEAAVVSADQDAAAQQDGARRQRLTGVDAAEFLAAVPAVRQTTPPAAARI